MFGSLIENYDGSIPVHSDDSINRTLNKVFLKIIGFTQLARGFLDLKFQITGIASKFFLQPQYIFSPLNGNLKRFVRNRFIDEVRGFKLERLDG